MKYILNRDQLFESQEKPRYIRVENIAKYEELLITGKISEWMGKIMADSVERTVHKALDEIGGYKVNGEIQKKLNKELYIPIAKLSSEDDNFMSDFYNDHEIFEELTLELTSIPFDSCLPPVGKKLFTERYGDYKPKLLPDIDVVKNLNGKSENSAINLELRGRLADSLEFISPMKAFIEICREIALDHIDTYQSPKFKPRIYRKIPDPKDLTKETMDMYFKEAMESENKLDTEGIEINTGRCAIEILIGEKVSEGFNQSLAGKLEEFYGDLLSVSSAEEVFI